MDSTGVAGRGSSGSGGGAGPSSNMTTCEKMRPQGSSTLCIVLASSHACCKGSEEWVLAWRAMHPANGQDDLELGMLWGLEPGWQVVPQGVTLHVEVLQGSHSLNALWHLLQQVILHPQRF